MATATVTISRGSPADIKPTVPLSPGIRPSIEQDAQLQQQHTDFGQREHAYSVSEDNAGQYTAQSQPKVAIASLGQQQQQPIQPAAPRPNFGPLSGQVTVPARPKPGRKPLPQEDAADRRRVQNRMAQRNFRDKRAQKVSELTQDNDRIRREKDEVIRGYELQLEDRRQECNRLKARVEELERNYELAIKRAEAAENKLHSVDSFKRFKEAGFPNPVLQNTTTSAALPSIATNWRGPVSDFAAANASAMTPPDEEFPETDMSSLWNSRLGGNRQSNANNQDHGTQWLGSGMDIDPDKDDCGFCTDESNCSCLQSKKAAATKTIAPGGCDACIKDPARAEACRALAAKTDYSPMPATSQNHDADSSIQQRNDSMAPPPPPTGGSGMMSCSKFIDRVEGQGLGQRVPSISELFGGIASHAIHSYPPGSGAGAGYDVNEQEAAHVLQTMSRRPSRQLPKAPTP